MNSIVYVGMDVHKESYTVCCYSFDTDKVLYQQKMPSDYKMILKYLEQLRNRFADDTTFVCGYEAGCLGYSLYHQLTHVTTEIQEEENLIKQDFSASKPLKKLLTDISQIPCFDGELYISPILDCFNGEILSF